METNVGNRENVRIARLFGEDTAKFLKDSMKSLSEQLFSLPKIIEKSNQESETLVDKKIQLEKKTMGKEVKKIIIKQLYTSFMMKILRKRLIMIKMYSQC